MACWRAAAADPAITPAPTITTARAAILKAPGDDRRGRLICRIRGGQPAVRIRIVIISSPDRCGRRPRVIKSYLLAA